MNIVVIGAGKIGSAIIASLVEEGHDVTAVDSNPRAIEEITDSYDIMCVCGNGADVDALREASAGSAKLFVACTESDDTNMLACFLARRMGAAHTIARIRNPEYNDDSFGFTCQQLDISEAINPDRRAATEIFRILKFPSAVNIETFSGRFELIELVLRDDSPLTGIPLSELRKKYPADFLICAVQRAAQTFIPSGSDELMPGDRIAMTASPYVVQKLLGKMGILRKSAKDVMIIGASRTAFYLSKQLTSAGIRVKVIDSDREACVRFSTELNDPAVTVINGDGASQSLLLEEGLSDMDALVSLTGSDEENILISLFAAGAGVPKTATKVNRPELAQMAEKLGLESVIIPGKIVSSQLSRYARAVQNSEGSNVEALYRVLDGSAEAIEFRVKPDFPYIGIPLRDMSLQKNILIGGIIRGRRALIPTGTETIMEDDRVVVISSGHRLLELSDIVDSGNTNPPRPTGVAPAFSAVQRETV
ncbi:MAG: Trk system potassium transporter TrkA [Clostridia bacterium]|nr:Trk system potassium transporter TrkA [Clostridia bacterium]